MTPHIEQSSVDGETTVRFESMAEALSTLRLHCVETSVLSCAREDGTPLEFRLADGILSVELGTPVAKGAAGAVTVRYRSRPTQGLYFHAPSKDNPSTPLEMYSQGEGTDPGGAAAGMSNAADVGRRDPAGELRTVPGRRRGRAVRPSGRPRPAQGVGPAAPGLPGRPACGEYGSFCCELSSA